jgi:hypothetical protein
MLLLDAIELSKLNHYNVVVSYYNALKKLITATAGCIFSFNSCQIEGLDQKRREANLTSCVPNHRLLRQRRRWRRHLT